MSIKAYYNEIDGFCCGWISNLMDAGLITPGKIDNRSIHDVRPDDFAGYDRQHFFAGIAGWDLALNLAGWGDRPVMSGSCPCQPFSHAGSEKGIADERHLWPAFFSLIKIGRPPVVIGEQVENAIKHGWLDLVFSDLESEGYACGAAVLPACGVGAPHKRQRLYWAGAVGDPDRLRLLEQRETEGAEVQGEPSEREGAELQEGLGQNRLLPGGTEGLGGVGGFWGDVEWIECGDGCLRPVERGTSALADGLPQIVGQLHAYGNAIVPQVAAAFVMSIKPQ